MNTPARTAAEGLVDWALGLDLADVPVAVVDAVSRHLLDGLGTAAAAARLGAGAAAVSVAAGLGGPPEATLLGGDARISAPAAALASGTLVHALDFDDTHAGGLVHATATVLPAVLATGEQVGASGEAALLAAVIGYETVCRIAAAAPHAFHQRGIHATSACGVLAAALAAARLTGLDRGQAVSALGIAGSQAGGLLEFLATGASTKQLHPGLAAQSGILAARLAAAGAEGPTSVLEGERGFFAALADARVTPESLLQGLGDRWECTRITIKPYPSCQLMHSTLDAGRYVLPLVDDTATDDIEVVTADVHPDSAAIVCRSGGETPRTVYDAKFSLPWSLAALLVDGSVTLDTYTVTGIERPEVVALARRVEVRTVHFPGVAADAAGRVTVALTDGRVLVGTVPRSAGGPDRPLDAAAFRAKLVANVGDASLADALAAAVEALPKAADLTTLASLAAEACRHAPTGGDR